MALSAACLDVTVYHGDDKIMRIKRLYCSKLLGRCDTRCAVASPVMQDSMDSDGLFISNVKSLEKISEKLLMGNRKMKFIIFYRSFDFDKSAHLFYHKALIW